VKQPTSPSPRPHAVTQRPPAHRRPKAPPPETRSLLLGGQRVPYVLKVSTQARRLRLVIRPRTGLEVIVPHSAPLASHEPFLREKERWILATLERMRLATASLAPRPLTDGSRLRYAGRELTLVVRIGAPRGHYRASLVADALTLTLPEADPAVARRALEAWYRRQAEAVFAERLATCNRPYGYRYQRVSVKAQKTRWGSCSKLGNLNFNWRLLLAPLPVLDYVVVHELCHLKEMNHGPRFWKLVTLACPDHAVHRRWLRQHGRELAL